jgi:hypothetical protein
VVEGLIRPGKIICKECATIPFFPEEILKAQVENY